MKVECIPQAICSCTCVWKLEREKHLRITQCGFYTRTTSTFYILCGMSVHESSAVKMHICKNISQSHGCCNRKTARLESVAKGEVKENCKRMKVSETARFTFWRVANSSQAQLCTIVRAESASLFDQEASSLERRETNSWHGPRYRQKALDLFVL